MTLGVTIAWLLCAGVISVFIVLGIVFFLILVRRLVRVGWFAAVIVTLLFSLVYFEPTSGAATWVPGLLAMGVLVFTIVRFGVLAGVVAEASVGFAASGLRSGDPSNWTFSMGMITAAAIVALALWATKTALAGRSLFGGAPGLDG